ncbi:response regulator [Mucilaginibacter sp. SMC90]|uniref:response regulator n=1 Tax=Mucilaginibacter sp. SMC90 TaxID=2929803 RepID=UPI001FB42BD0|nr:response regulator [Mucilaginibacter sp. SMC90]UOE51781.1 response regulator [Mucilaginibacter sp. SMC90]
MLNAEKITCYCFNKDCAASIYNDTTCLSIQVPLEVALSRTLNCIECGAELLSPLLIEIKKDILNLIKDDQRHSVAIIDDDIIFHETVKIILKDNWLNASFYMNPEPVYNALYTNRNKHAEIPNIIFLDLDMPLMDGWEFLDLFNNLHRSLVKPVSIYIISNSVDPADQKRIKAYPFVKSFISKPLTRHFLGKINEEVSRNAAGLELKPASNW